MDRFLFWLTRNRPCKVININGARYMERYFLFYLWGFEFVLHRYLGGDSDRSPHDHPSNAFSIILNGGYVEELVEYLSPTFGFKLAARRRRWFNYVPASTFHIVRQVMPRTWTLFIFGEPVQVGGTKKGWGFLKFNGDYPIGLVYEAGPSHGAGWSGVGNRDIVGAAPLDYWEMYDVMTKPPEWRTNHYRK